MLIEFNHFCLYLHNFIIIIITDKPENVTSKEFFCIWEGGMEKSATEVLLVFQCYENICIIILLFQITMAVLSMGIN